MSGPEHEWQWAYSHNGGEYYYGWYSSREEALEAGKEGNEDDDGIWTAECKLLPLYIDLGGSLVCAFLDENEYLDCEGFTFDCAELDEQLREDVQRALVQWIERMGGFPHRALETRNEMKHCKEQTE